MCLRSPPAGSLADEILSSDPKSSYARAKSILSSIRDMADRYSDFASCDSSLGETDTEAAAVDTEVGFQHQGVAVICSRIWRDHLSPLGRR